MQTSPSDNLTQLLMDWSKGDRAALDQLMPVVYDELRKIARSYLRGERPTHTLQPTALIHEAYLRLIDSKRVQLRNRAHFIGVAARLMRQILVAIAREHGAQKRGGGAERVSLDEAMLVGARREEDLVALDEALDALAQIDARKAQVVELRLPSFIPRLVTKSVT